jgi:hypothetical protein
MAAVSAKIDVDHRKRPGLVAENQGQETPSGLVKDRVT